MRKASVAVAAVGIAGCVMPPSPSQRLAESAYEMNAATRFGRMDVAIELVAPPSRDDFAKKHAGWGRELRVVDLELTGLRMTANDRASVLLSVSWQRSDEAHVRVTHIEQRWRDDRGGWQLASEERSGGDAGLLEVRPKAGSPASGERASAETNPSARAGFQTRVIRGVD